MFALLFNTNVHGDTLPSFTQMPPLQFTNEALAFAFAVTVIVVLFGSDVPAGDWEAVPGPFVDKAIVYFVTVVTPVPVRPRPNPDGSFGSFDCRVSCATRLPVACGVNVIVNVHDPPMGMLTPTQLFVCV